MVLSNADRAWIFNLYKEVLVLSKIIFYPPQDGCTPQVHLTSPGFKPADPQGRKCANTEYLGFLN